MEIMIRVDEAFTQALEHLAQAVCGAHAQPLKEEQPKQAEPPKHTLEQISKAGAALLTKNPGVTAKLCALLRDKYQANALTKIDPSRYDEMAQDLKDLGAEVD